MNVKKSTLTIPLSGLRCLSGLGKRKIICEIDLSSLRKVNEPETIDEMIAEAELEYYSGQTKSFKSAKKLIAYLNS